MKLKSWNRSYVRDKREKPEAEILSVKKLFADDRLNIPDYQRPYKWEVRHVNQFISDLLQHADKDHYRIGNMVVHNNDGKYDIVDGQQRFITLLLIMKAIQTFQPSSLNKIWENAEAFLNGNNLKFSNSITQYNLYHNYQHIKQQSGDLYRIRNFITDRVQLVQFILQDQSEAFQFFDSQNARGRKLYPHDLLKAFHLREFPEEEEYLKVDVVEVWEDMESEELAELFEQYLYRIKVWSKGQKAWYFSNNKIDWFKGININKSESYPFINSFKLIHNRIDDISKDMPAYFESRKYVFPYQLDQIILNGRRFFEMVSVYKSLIDSVTSGTFAEKQLDSTAKEILETIYSYEGYRRSGDTYVRNLFQAALIYYIDRFGNHGLSEAIKRLFVWSYQKRLEMYAVRVETTANHALEGFTENQNKNAFRVIRDSIQHTEIRKLANPAIENPKREIPEIIDLMKKLNVQIEGLSES